MYRKSRVFIPVVLIVLIIMIASCRYAAGVSAQDNIPVLVQKLSDDSLDVRREALDALVAIGKPAVSSLGSIFSGDKPSDVKKMAGEALVRIGPASVDVLISALRVEPVRSQYLVPMSSLLARIGTPAVKPLIAALRNPDPQIRAGAASSLGMIRDPVAVSTLR